MVHSDAQTHLNCTDTGTRATVSAAGVFVATGDALAFTTAVFDHLIIPTLTFRGFSKAAASRAQ